MSLLERVLAADVQDAGAADGLEGLSLAPMRKRLKRDLVDRLGLAAVASVVGGEAAERSRSELAVTLQAILNDGGYEGMDQAMRSRLVTDVLDEVVGLGPIQSLLDDPSVTEVMVNGCGSLFFERGGRLEEAERVFDSAEQIMLVVDRILAPLGRRLDETSPIVNARLANGDRVNAVIAPIAIDGPVVTIRKFSGRVHSLRHLVELGSLPAWYAQLLSWAVRARQDIAVAGGTGSGKTTLLNALSREIDPAERIITIEDSAELSFDEHPHVVRLETRDPSLEGRGQVSIRDLVTNSLRMRPDRIIVGEVRGEECIDMLQAMNTGHDGSMTTLHAGTEDEAVLRLVLMARFGMDLPAQIVEEQIATALDFVVMGRRLPQGARRVTSASAVSRSADGGVALDPIVTYDEGEDHWTLVKEPAFLEEALETGLIDSGEVARWRRAFS